jgi:hypothetical protein
VGVGVREMISVRINRTKIIAYCCSVLITGDHSHTVRVMSECKVWDEVGTVE